MQQHGNLAETLQDIAVDIRWAYRTFASFVVDTQAALDAVLVSRYSNKHRIFFFRVNSVVLSSVSSRPDLKDGWNNPTHCHTMR